MMPLLAVGVLLGPFVINLLYDERYAGAEIILSIFIARQMIRGIGQLQFQLLLTRGEVNRATIAYGVAFVVQAVMFVPMVQSLVFIFAVLTVLFNILADILYGLLDPRIRYD